MSRVGDKIKEARLKVNMTQKVLAKKLGVAEKYINEVEMGRKVANEAFIDRVAKTLGVDLNDVSMVVTDEDLMEERKSQKFESSKRKIEEKNELWTDAFSNVLRKVPIYDYTLKTIKGYKEMPIHSNKIEGFTQDKVIYLEVQNDEMLGFRMDKGDLAFAHLTKDFVNNGIFLIDHNGERKIRQIKKLDSSKLLLMYNRVSVMTETVDIKAIDIIAKLERIEIKL